MANKSTQKKVDEMYDLYSIIKNRKFWLMVVLTIVVLTFLGALTR